MITKTSPFQRIARRNQVHLAPSFFELIAYSQYRYPHVWRSGSVWTIARHLRRVRAIYQHVWGLPF